MPKDLRYTEKLQIRLPPGTRDRIAALPLLPGEKLADTQRRVVLAGLDAVEAAATKPKAGRKVRT